MHRLGDANESDYGRALMLPQELLHMPATDALVHIEGLRPIECKRIRYYSDPTFTKRLASVAPSLHRRPVTVKGLQAAIGAGELAAPVPVAELAAQGGNYLPTPSRALTGQDAKAGIDLTAIDLDFSSLPEHDEPMSDIEVDQFVSAFCNAVGISDHTPETVSVELESADRELVDLSPLRA